MAKCNRIWHGFMLLVAVILNTGVTALEEPSINIALKTSFNAGPYLVELLETAAIENATAYFPLLDRIADGAFADLQTDKELYEKFIEILRHDGHIDNEEELSSFNMALASRAAAPRVEAHFQYYKTSVEPKMMAAQDAACPVWVHLDGQQYCSPTLERAQQPFDMGDADMDLPFDRVLGDAGGVPSVLYADITHPLFGQFHETVSRTARSGKSSYRVRYRPSSDVGSRPLYVSGYGAELNLKRTDYIVIDDRDAANSGDTQKVDENKSEKIPDLKPLTTSELSGLGLNTASYVMSGSNPMEILLDVSANFPSYSSAIAAANVSSDFVSEHLKNRDILLPPGFNVIFMNGLQLESRHINTYSLLDILKRERRLIGQLQEVGLTSTEAVDLLSEEVLAQALSAEEPPRYDWRDDEEGGAVIIWMNNIEEDARYAQWPATLRMLLQRTYPGQLPQVRRDIHNLVVPVDLGDIKDIDLVVNALSSLVQRQIPVRIGLVPMAGSEAATELAKVSYYVFDTYGLNGLMTLYENIVTSKSGLNGLQATFEKMTTGLSTEDGKSLQTYSEILESDPWQEHIDAANAYLKRLVLQAETSDVLVNGVAIQRDEQWFEKTSQRLARDNQILQVGVYENTISDSIWPPQVFLDTATSKRNTLVIPNDAKNIKILSVADIHTEFYDLFATLPRLSGGESTLLSEQAYVLLAADFETDIGFATLKAAVDFHRKHPETEVVLVHNHGDDAKSQTNVGSQLFAALQTKLAGMTSAALEALLDTEGHTELSADILNEAATFWADAHGLVHRLGLKPGEQGLWLNGRMIGPFKDSFSAEDFETLLDFERKSRIAPVTTAITSLDLEDKFRNALDLAKVTSIIARSLKSDVPEGIYESSPPIRIDRFKRWIGQHTLIHLPSKGKPTIQIVAAIDPASETAQPWIPILKTLSELSGIDVKIYLNPRNKLEELPIKRYYSQVISSTPLFEEDGSLTVPRASFRGVPQETLFNLGMVVPPAWLVAPQKTVYDLDNIKLSSVPAGQNVDAVYEIEHILIDGHSRDVTKGPPPRGVQLLLGSEQDPLYADTLIMANLGYFQFKANPGYWHISLKSGRSSQIFNIDSAGAKGYAAQPGDETTSVALLSFQGLTLYPRLSRKPGMEEEDVLEASAASVAKEYLGKGASFASSALSSLGFKKHATTKNADINIFSVASGHLYERMLNIMMVSVMRHTKHTVKFWFIEQFLSPSFKAGLPTLASHYNFKYEMVTYKWPHWLRGQKEKQREIWGYKILFLDVLFPLDLDKVIFVDADQIVRTDMMDLNRVDLQGAPYGFTPMCDSRTEMEGYRFWKQGYWKNYLAGKPYHISALYVVDLKRFRELAAGDRLRQQYHALSQDPASLSNLDQDLPNHMQHSLPIHSLSQDWLWCKTWCSDESLGAARTIDLCQDPETRTPKLERARQVPEWTVYDEEIAAVLQNAKSTFNNSNSASDADVQQALGQGTNNDRRVRDEL